MADEDVLGQVVIPFDIINQTHVFQRLYSDCHLFRHSQSDCHVFQCVTHDFLISDLMRYLFAYKGVQWERMVRMSSSQHDMGSLGFGSMMISMVS